MKSTKIQTNRPLLILLYGFPGAGKTHFARQLSTDLHSAHVHGDRIRYELFEQPRYDREENGIVTQLMEYMTEEFLAAGLNVIYDTNAARFGQRRALRDMARKHGAESLIVWFQMDPDSAYNRTRNRDRRKSDDKYARDYTPDMFKRYIAHMQQPQNEDYVVVSGKHVFTSQRTAILKKLIELGYIETLAAQDKVVKPGLINLVPRAANPTSMDFERRNIHIR